MARHRIWLNTVTLAGQTDILVGILKPGFKNYSDVTYSEIEINGLSGGFTYSISPLTPPYSGRPDNTGNDLDSGVKKKKIIIRK